MSEMIERVARAMCEADGGAPDQLVNPFRGPAAVMSNGYVAVFGQVPHWATYENMARSAIAAMREPTFVMIGAGVMEKMCPVEAVKPVYQAMIDEALRDGE